MGQPLPGDQPSLPPPNEPYRFYPVHPVFPTRPVPPPPVAPPIDGPPPIYVPPIYLPPTDVPSADVPAAEPKVRKGSDRLAVAVANASLLSVGYMMARRGGLAFLSLLVTITTDALGQVRKGIRLADAPLAVKDDQTGRACRRLQNAGDRLTTGLTGDTAALGDGFTLLGSVITEMPGHENMVGTVLDRFLAGLPTKNPCRTVTITDWLAHRTATGNELDRSAAVVPATAPAALTGCADSQLSSGKPDQAKKTYQQLLTRYPADKLTTRAKAGIKKADLAIQLNTVRASLAGSTAGQPDYCSHPVKYPPAKAYGNGTNRAMFFGNDSEVAHLPATWVAGDVTKAALVVCLGADKQGAAVRTCTYQSYTSAGRTDKVTFHKVTFTVRAYEVRTGRLVLHKTLQFSGTSCPYIVSYTTTYDGTDLGPPRNQSVDVAATDVKAAFRQFIVH